MIASMPQVQYTLNLFMNRIIYFWRCSQMLELFHSFKGFIARFCFVIPVRRHEHALGCLSFCFLHRSPYWRQIELLCKILPYGRKLRGQHDTSFVIGASAPLIFAFQRPIHKPHRKNQQDATV